MSRDEWITYWPAQVVQTTNQIMFTYRVTQAIQTGKLDFLKNFVIEKMEFLTNLARNNEISQLHRDTIQSLLVLDVHNRDIAILLSKSKISSSNDFEWKGQLRYYIEEEKCIARIINAQFNYGNEYLGNTSRLVITPLTERCFRTLTR